MNTHIFTIMAGCVPVGAKMLESYFKYHSEKINVYVFSEDIQEFLKFLPSDKSYHFTVHVLNSEHKELFEKGHEGTAKVWADVIRQNKDSYLIQIDSDVIFKRESLSLIEKAGYPDIYGSRRCYQNNPGKAPVKEGLEDAISTYFLGFNPKYLNNILSLEGSNWGDYDRTLLEKMIQGVLNPLGFQCLDFFDPCFFFMRTQGAKVFYEEQEIIGGQDESGRKEGNYKSNLHFDCGSHLIHFGGVGSGYQATKNDSKMNKDYSDWAKERWELFEDLFYSGKNYPESKMAENVLLTKYDESGRWISGPYNINILNQLTFDLIN